MGFLPQGTAGDMNIATTATQMPNKSYRMKIADEKIIGNIDDLEAIAQACEKNKTRIVLDRRQAIVEAVCEAGAADVVLIAGKGHEDYQEIEGVKHHFDDKEEVEKLFAEEQA